MHLILRILKFDLLRVPPIQIPTKKCYTFSFVKEIHRSRTNLTFDSYYGVQEQNCIPRIMEFDILRLPLLQIPTKKCGSLGISKQIAMSQVEEWGSPDFCQNEFQMLYLWF
jgi:hypothetical protein